MKGLYPKEYVDSTYEIDFEGLYKKGYRGVIFDIDNTLVPHGAPADERATAFFRKMHEMGYATLMLSNNKEPRVKLFCDAVNAPYIYKGGKPKTEGYYKAMEVMGTTVEKTLLNLYLSNEEDEHPAIFGKIFDKVGRVKDAGK